MDTVECTLADYQDDLICSDNRRVAIIGAKGCGKTWAGARFLLNQVTKQPNEQHLVMLNTLGQARDVFYQDIEPLLQQLNWPYHFNSQPCNLKVFNTIIHLRSAESDAIERIESISYASGGSDEASFYDFESFKIFVSRIRNGSSIVRVTSMPDEPDHWMYDILSKGKFVIHEKSLRDNPDKNFRENYEEILRSIYNDSQLKRYLDGSRVSLAGLGLFGIDPNSRQPTEIDKKEDLYIFWDFNVAYRAVSVWQIIGKDHQATPIVACVESHQMKKQTVYDDAIELARLYQTHEGTIYLGGDASENKRSSQTTESIWQTVRRAFKEEGVPIRSVVPSANPNVKDTIQCCNWAFKQKLVRFDVNEKNVYNSLQACRADRYGEIDKSGDDKPGGAKSHEADTARYFLWHIYKRLYPGGKSKVWAI